MPLTARSALSADAVLGLDHDHLSWLLTRSAVGDETAFADLYDVTSKRVFGLVLRCTGRAGSIDPARAERITERIYLRLWRQADRFDPRTSGHALCWLITVVQHQLAEERLLTSGNGTSVQDLPRRLTRRQQDIVTLVCLGHFSQRQVANLLRVPRGAVAAALRDGLDRVRPKLPAAS